MDKFKRLVFAHAEAIEERNRLKKLAADAYQKCLHSNEKNGFELCTQRAHRECKELNAEAGPYDGYSYGEVLFNMEDPEACDHCKEAYELKKPRAAIGRRIGAIRAAMTRMYKAERAKGVKRG